MIDREREIIGLLINAKEDLEESCDVDAEHVGGVVYALQAIAGALLAIAQIMIFTGKKS